jgi:hypothetical protein
VGVAAQVDADELAKSDELEPAGAEVGQGAGGQPPGDGWLSRPDATLIVEWTIGSPKVLAVFTVDTMFLSSRPGSMERTPASCEGWYSLGGNAAFCSVRRWSESGSRTGGTGHGSGTFF